MSPDEVIYTERSLLSMIPRGLSSQAVYKAVKTLRAILDEFPAMPKPKVTTNGDSVDLDWGSLSDEDAGCFIEFYHDKIYLCEWNESTGYANEFDEILDEDAISLIGTRFTEEYE